MAGLAKTRPAGNSVELKAELLNDKRGSLEAGSFKG